MSEKQIKDPIHGYITVESGFVDNIVDTHLFQRLRNLRQMDTTEKSTRLQTIPVLNIRLGYSTWQKMLSAKFDLTTNSKHLVKER